MAKRALVIQLTRGQSQLIDQERQRLKDLYGLRMSGSQIVQTLLEQHRLKIKMMANEDPESVHWFYRRMAEQ